MYCVQLKKYVLCTNLRGDLSSDEEPEGLNVSDYRICHVMK